jgi:hypothetical protein
MENKKLLGYILKDLIALEEILGGTENLQLDEIETEFVQTRLKSARKLVQMVIEYPEEKAIVTKQDIQKDFEKIEVEMPTVTVASPAVAPEKPTIEEIIEMPRQTDVSAVKESNNKEEAVNENILEQIPVAGVIVNEIMGFLEETITEIAEEEGVTLPAAEEEEDEWKQEKPVKAEPVKKQPVQQELKLDEDSAGEQQNKRLGDIFSKEKSVNDLIAGDAQKLEQKISNMPVTSIQAAIGINDRFQFIRELFDGSAEKYTETVTKLDSMKELKEAVTYLQQNFKWKKTEVSLKFVSLIKRRFPQ